MAPINENYKERLSYFEKYYAQANGNLKQDKWNVTIKVYGDAYWGSVGTNPGWEGKNSVRTIQCARFIETHDFYAWLWYNPEWEEWCIDGYRPRSKTIGYNIYRLEII